MRVGYIGLGSQGAPMAHRIIAAGYETTLWARRAETLEPFQGRGATFAATPAELGSACELVCLCVVNDADVEQVVGELLPAMAAGGVIAVQSTVRPETCLRLAAAAAERDITLIDAPVSGGAPAAEAGELLVMVGGDAETFERCKPVFSTYGNPVVHVGPLGSGQLAKLVNNVLFIAHLGIANDAYVLGEGLGLDRNALYTIVSRGSGNSFGLGIMSARTLPEMGALAGTLLRKDLDIVTEVAAERGADGGSLIDVANDAVERMEGE
jgi:3-hydroxyisobutyrate dehydrogenase-like beta-hydroxyacid dehydrogenase